MARVSSFSYRKGIPPADAVFDCRHVDNPDRGIRAFTGMHPTVAAQVLACQASGPLLDEAEAWARANPDGHLAFGCNYGYHRSVALAEALAARLGVEANHFDI